MGSARAEPGGGQDRGQRPDPGRLSLEAENRDLTMSVRLSFQDLGGEFKCEGTGRAGREAAVIIFIFGIQV
jgi:hypothetical protein